MTTIAALEHALNQVDGLDYRLAGPDDRDVERALLGSTLAGLDHLPPAARDQLTQLQFDAQQASHLRVFPDATRWIICRTTRPVGRIWIDCSNDRIHIIDVTIEPSARGEGIGSRTLTALIGLCDEHGLPLDLRVAVDNAGARRLYLRLGFVTTVESDSFLTMTRT